MTHRKCPVCNKQISTLNTLNLCPAKTYSCPHCSIPLTISDRSHHILIYGALLTLLPTLVYFIAEPSLVSVATVGLAFLFLALLTLMTQKIISAKTYPTA